METRKCIIFAYSGNKYMRCTDASNHQEHRKEQCYLMPQLPVTNKNSLLKRSKNKTGDNYRQGQ